MAVKKSLQTVAEQASLEGSFESRRRVEKRLKQTIPNRWASQRNQSLTKHLCVYTRRGKGTGVSCGSYLSGNNHTLTL